MAAFVGDSFTAPAQVGTPVDNWAEHVASSNCWAPTYLGKHGSGYVNPAGSAWQYVNRVPQVTASAPDLVVVQGSTNDLYLIGVREAAVGTLALIRAQNPYATVVVVGPVKAPRYDLVRLTALRDELAAAAAVTGALFVDPLDGDWLGDDDFADGLHLTTEGNARFGAKVVDRLDTVGVSTSCT
ncbi:SGNH/GDSL hydrolase family protein [Dietzia cercidiphylli]|uniref:SGNH/GDSL hydrolase family protein n=1 Tax=Dietzia cercidiphylli TaxID=498199 RepID=UPI0031E1AFB4|nr:SGNH/GDSL hydrolase family protein [Dietzia cercidiphylli]